MFKNTYNNKKIFLISLITVLALLYAGSVIFSPQRSSNRSASFAWIDSKAAGKINKIVIDATTDEIEFIKKETGWFVLYDGNEYPARKSRIEDFIGVFTSKSPWHVRSSSASSHERFGLDENAFRVKVYTDSVSVLDLLLGYEDMTGREVYVRRYAQNEVRSGDNRISAYITSPAVSWYNLRLIPESEDGKMDISAVQRISVYDDGRPLVISRKNRVWTVSDLKDEDVDQSSVENYIRTVLNTEGDNFSDAEYDFSHSRITLEFGNGSVKTINFSDSDETGRRFASVGGSVYFYSVPSWSASRLFRDAQSFAKQY